jgi:hypothetical protein
MQSLWYFRVERKPGLPRQGEYRPLQLSNVLFLNAIYAIVLRPRDFRATVFAPRERTLRRERIRSAPMRRALAVATIGALAVASCSFSAAARTGEVFVRQVSQARDSAYVRQMSGPTIHVSMVFRPLYRMARPGAYPIPPYAAPGLSGDTALGFFLNNNRGLFEDHDRIFRDFLR